MGRPRIKIIDDSQKEVKKETTKQVKRAKSEVVKAIGEVERTTEPNESSEELGAKQTNSESTGETNGALRPDERATQKKSQKPGKAKPRSKKYQEKSRDLDRTKTYPLDEAVDMAKKLSYAKFNATLEAHINTAQTGIRGLVSLPYASGRQLRILAFGPSPAPKLPGVVFGSDSTIEEISKGPSASSGLDFDLIITTPEWMPKLTKVAKILGPRGLMPNPKNGTITDDLKKTVEGFQAGKTEYKTEAKVPVIHIVMGKLDQPTEELSANIKTLLQTLGKTRVKKLTLSPTMGPGVKVDLASI